MHDSAELEENARKAASIRMERVRSLGGYDIAARKWHNFRPAESLGRPPLQVPKLLISSSLEPRAGVGTALQLPALSSRSSANPTTATYNSAPDQAESKLKGPGSSLAFQNDVQGHFGPRPLNYVFPRGFPISQAPSLPANSTGALVSRIEEPRWL